MSLDDPAWLDTEETRGDRIADDRPGPESTVAEMELQERAREEIAEAMVELDPRERHIIQRRYLNRRPATLKELGESFGISRERVRQLEARAKAKMRTRLLDLWEHRAA